MHEGSIAEALLTQVDATARRHGSRAVGRVIVSLGELSGVEPDLLQTAFAVLREGSICAAATLELEMVPAQ